jgi:hypothetical protein
MEMSGERWPMGLMNGCFREIKKLSPKKRATRPEQATFNDLPPILKDVRKNPHEVRVGRLGPFQFQYVTKSRQIKHEWVNGINHQ